MSDYFAPAVISSPPPYAAAPQGASASRRRWPVLLGAAAALAGIAAAGWWWTGRGATELRVPDTLAGIAPAPAAMDMAGPTWTEDQSDRLGMEVTGRTYAGGPGTRPLALNLIVVGGRSTLDIDLGADGTARPYGEVSCTQTFRLTPESAPAENPGMVLCWRSTRQLTVSVLILGTDASFVPTAAAAVQEVWDLQG